MVSEFKPGDIVQFKSREEIQELNRMEEILFGWNSQMNELCGRVCRVERRDAGGSLVLIELSTGRPPMAGGSYTWSYSDSMLKTADGIKDPETGEILCSCPVCIERVQGERAAHEQVTSSGF